MTPHLSIGSAMVVALVLLVPITLAGCAAESPVTQPYFGSTETIDQLVSDVNANIEPLPTLWAKGDYDASIVENHHQTNLNGTFYLMHARPQLMLFRGNADVVGEVFRMGCGPEKYWVTVKGDTDTCWWGTYANLDHADPHTIPVRPDLVEAVLGLDGMDTDLTRQPCPVMRFNNDQHAYMIVWNVKGPDRWLAQKEIWYDLDSKLPKLVNLFDANGRVVLSAYLSDHRAVDTGGNGTTQPGVAKVATNYRLFFPESGSTLKLHLTEMRLKSRGVPNAHTFAFDPDTVDVKHVLSLDSAH